MRQRWRSPVVVSHCPVGQAVKHSSHTLQGNTPRRTVASGLDREHVGKEQRARPLEPAPKGCFHWPPPPHHIACAWPDCTAQQVETAASRQTVQPQHCRPVRERARLARCVVPGAAVAPGGACAWSFDRGLGTESASVAVAALPRHVLCAVKAAPEVRLHAVLPAVSRDTAVRLVVVLVCGKTGNRVEQVSVGVGVGWACRCRGRRAETWLGRGSGGGRRG